MFILKCLNFLWCITDASTHNIMVFQDFFFVISSASFWDFCSILFPSIILTRHNFSLPFFCLSLPFSFALCLSISFSLSLTNSLSPSHDPNVYHLSFSDYHSLSPALSEPLSISVVASLYLPFPPSTLSMCITLWRTGWERVEDSQEMRMEGQKEWMCVY